MMDFETWKQRREEMMREAEQNRLAKALRESRGPRRVSPLVWELKRVTGRLLKLLRSLKRVGQERRNDGTPTPIEGRPRLGRRNGRHKGQQHHR
jgi:hypothetical protein